MRSFLFALVVCVIMLVSLFAIVDSFSNLSGIVSAWRKSGQSVVALPLMILEMNLVRMPLIFYELAPVLTLSAAMFTIAKLRRANEITPLLASGVSIYRVLWPIFFMAILLTVLQVANREFVIPRLGDSIFDWDRIRDASSHKWRNQVIVEDRFGNIVFAGRYYIADKRQQHAQITTYYRAENRRQPRVILNAGEAQWVDSPTPGWRYANGTVIEYDSAGTVLRQASFAGDGKFVPFREQAPAGSTPDLFTDVEPQRLETKQVDIFYRPTLYLLEYAHEHGLKADIALDINKRIAAPLTNFVLLLIGLPFALRRDMKNPFLGIALAVAITAVYYAVSLLCDNFALNGRFLTPLTGAWAPNIIFGPVGVLLFDTMDS
jgi:lipopolysaccharide export LptBFGC system permease protein LptF